MIGPPCEIHVESNGAELSCTVGGVIRGRVIIRARRNRTCRKITVGYFWSTPRYRSNPRLWTIATRERWRAGEVYVYTFSIPAPLGPATYTGHWTFVQWTFRVIADVVSDVDAVWEGSLQVGREGGSGLYDFGAGSVWTFVAERVPAIDRTIDIEHRWARIPIRLHVLPRLILHLPHLLYAILPWRGPGYFRSYTRPRRERWRILWEHAKVRFAVCLYIAVLTIWLPTGSLTGAIVLAAVCTLLITLREYTLLMHGLPIEIHIILESPIVHRGSQVKGHIQVLVWKRVTIRKVEIHLRAIEFTGRYADRSPLPDAPMLHRMVVHRVQQYTRTHHLYPTQRIEFPFVFTIAPDAPCSFRTPDGTEQLVWYIDVRIRGLEPFEIHWRPIAVIP